MPTPLLGVVCLKESKLIIFKLSHLDIKLARIYCDVGLIDWSEGRELPYTVSNVSFVYSARVLSTYYLFLFVTLKTLK